MRIIIIGAGDVGFNIAKRLVDEDKEVVVIDKDPQVLARVEDTIDVEIICGDGNDPRILEKAGVREGDLLLSVTNSDEINLIASTFASILAPNIFKVARIRNPGYLLYKEEVIKDFLKIDMVINPEEEVVKYIKHLLEIPGAIDIYEFMDIGIKLIAISIKKETPVVEHSLAEIKDAIGIREFIVGGIIRGEELIIPSGEDVIKQGDIVYFVCHKTHEKKVMDFFGLAQSPPRDILIIGGGNVGFSLARSLEKKRGLNIKLIDFDKKRCEFLAEELDSTMVLQGDGTDQKLLLEENAGHMDVVISVTGDEETNVLSSLLAKRLGVVHTITRVNKHFYLPLLRALGLEHVVSSRLCAANSILRYVRKGKVISSVSLKEDAEALEIVAREDSFLVDRPIKALSLPREAVILCMVRRGEVLIPTGDDVIHPGDRVIILSRASKISAIEDLITG